MRYVFACDEHGNTGWPRGTKKFVFGGFAVEQNARQEVISKWEEIKLDLCGSSRVELKWKHFFQDPHQNRGNSPLISKNPAEWRDQAKWALHEIFKGTKITPINAIVHKDEATEGLLKIRKGKEVMDIETVFLGIVAQFALFLVKHKAEGEIWHDQLGSKKQESRIQKAWEIGRNEPWPVNPERQAMLYRIAPTIKFLDSKKEPLVQIADFISGVIYGAARGGEGFLMESWDYFFPEGLRTTNLLHVY